jgi:long-chain fatty acid transport protein
VVGLYYKFTEKFGVEFDYAWYGWSVFDEIVLEFEDPTLNQTIPEGYKDEYQLRLGAHYDINEQFSVRAGFIYDRTPQPIESVSPLLPDDTRTDWTLGAGYKTGNFVIDGGYMFVNIGERSTVENGVGMNDNGFDGTYISHAHLFYLSLGYSLK